MLIRKALAFVVLGLFVSSCSAPAEEQQVHAYEMPTRCKANHDCGHDGVCVVPGMALGPVGHCFTDEYVWCSGWKLPANEENWSFECSDSEVFAACQPQLSDTINALCRPAKDYDPTTEHFRYSCCSPGIFTW